MTYDDYGSYDAAAGVAAPAHAKNDLEALIQLAIEIVQQAKSMPLSASVLVSREELLDVLETAIHNLPEEIREARWALRDREELMAGEIRKAEQLMDRVRAEAARMVDKTEIVRNARVAADKIVAEANERARVLINEAEDFCDQKLGGMEIVLDRLTKTVKSGRERLRPSVASSPPPSATAPATAFSPSAPTPYASSSTPYASSNTPYASSSTPTRDASPSYGAGEPYEDRYAEPGSGGESFFDQDAY